MSASLDRRSISRPKELEQQLGNPAPPQRTHSIATPVCVRIASFGCARPRLPRHSGCATARRCSTRGAGYGWPPCAGALPIAVASAQVLCSSAAVPLLGLAPHLHGRSRFHASPVRLAAVQAAAALWRPLSGRRASRLVLQFGRSTDRASNCRGCVFSLVEYEALQACLTWFSTLNSSIKCNSRL